MTENFKRELRWREFSGPIMDLGLKNPVIHQVMSAYAAGDIVTKEEALSQMVVRLATHWERQRAEEVLAAQLAIFPPGQSAGIDPHQGSCLK